MVVFCSYYSIEAQAAQPAISDSRSVLQEQKGDQGQAVPTFKTLTSYLELMKLS